MRLKWMMASLFVLSCSTLYADTVAYYYAQPATGTLTSGSEGKKAGDIISLSTDADIAQRCDFSKQIVVTRTSVLCVYNGKNATTGQ